MPVQPSSPGVFVEEISSGIRSIPGVRTTVTAFVGFLKRGPLNSARKVISFGEFDRIYGGLDANSEVSYAVQQFFLNGGAEALIVRVAAEGPATDSVGTAAVIMQDEVGNPVLEARAESPGDWGNLLQVDVDYDQVDPATSFNLRVTEFVLQGGILVAATVESFRNLSMDPALTGYAVSGVNAGSSLIRLAVPTGVTHNDTTQPPAQSGTTSGLDISGVNKDNLSDTMTVMVVADGNDLVSNSFSLNTGVGTTSSQLRSTLQLALRTVSGLERATVQLFGDRLRISPAVDECDAIISFSGALATDLGLAGAGVVANVQAYSPGSGATLGNQTAAVSGSDGLRPGATELIGNQNDKTGMYALDDVDLFNILCIPEMAALNTTAAVQLITQATRYCEERRAFLIVDIPDKVKTVSEMLDWITDNATLRHRNAAVYFPRIMVADPLDAYHLKARPASGTLAGVYARTDKSRGVWKAPAGTEATLIGVQAFEYELTDAENGVLNPQGVNTLRTFTGFGNVSWGSRTLEGSDPRGSDWKYIPVRRTALFIEESIERGTQWAVFEPNDEPLWAQIRLNAGTFMQSLFRQGALQGSTPSQAYFVKCDRETTTQGDIDSGIVNIHVGFAPLKPAEFVIIRIQQKTGG